MDVETKGEFIKHLIKEVENAEFTNIEDVVTFVKWLDDELSYLVSSYLVFFFIIHSPYVYDFICAWQVKNLRIKIAD